MGKVFSTDGVRLCTESFGDPKDPALLLIMGAMSSMIWWDEEFCRFLASRGRFVIRFDNRDTGLSQTYEPGRPGYTVDDMADDCIRVLDFWNVKQAHFFGMSLGGMLAQITALKYPERIHTLTCLASRALASVSPPPPKTSSVVLRASERTRFLRWGDKKTVIEYMTDIGRMLCGKGRIFNEKRHRELAELEFDRSQNLHSLRNYLLLRGGRVWWNKAFGIRTPVTVIHGTDDVVLPLPHGEAIAKTIPGAKLAVLKGAGHELHKDDWGEIANTIGL